MTRNEFAIAMGLRLEHTPVHLYYSDVSWQQIYDNSCPDCRAYSVRGKFPVIHADGCLQQERGFNEGLKEIFDRVKKAENAEQTDYEEKA